MKRLWVFKSSRILALLFTSFVTLGKWFDLSWANRCSFQLLPTNILWIYQNALQVLSRAQSTFLVLKTWPFFSHSCQSPLIYLSIKNSVKGKKERNQMLDGTPPLMINVRGIHLCNYVLHILLKGNNRSKTKSLLLSCTKT